MIDWEGRAGATGWRLWAEDIQPVPNNMFQQLQQNKEKINKHFKKFKKEVDLNVGTPELGRQSLTKFLAKIGLENWVSDLQSYYLSLIKSGKADFTRIDFSLKIPGPGFTTPVGNPKGRKKAKFMVTKKKKYFGTYDGDFRPFEKELVDRGFHSFDDFYKAIKDCFGSEWQPKVFPDYGMDYKFRDEHQRAFDALVKQLDANACGKKPIETDEEEETPKPVVKKKKRKALPPGSIFISTPQHASCRIHEASNTLTYGEYDPLGIWGSKLPIQKLPLNETINEIFGYDGGWKEYQEKNSKDLRKKTIILRKDGRREEFDRPQDYTPEEGDRTNWPGIEGPCRENTEWYR